MKKLIFSAAVLVTLSVGVLSARGNMEKVNTSKKSNYSLQDTTKGTSSQDTTKKDTTKH